MDALLATGAGFLLVLLRAGALVMVAPLFGTRSVPARVRLALSLALAAVAFSAAGAPAFPGWTRTQDLLAAAVSETAVGLAAGVGSRLAIDAAGAAGSAMGLPMGLGFGAVLDPLHGAESTAISELLSMLTLGMAVAAGLHREAIAWLCQSVVAAPPGTPVALPELAVRLVAASADAGALAIRLAFPVMAAVTVGQIGLGLLGRAAPQLNLSTVGFSVAVLAGGGALYMAAPVVAALAARSARAVFVGG